MRAGHAPPSPRPRRRPTRAVPPVLERLAAALAGVTDPDRLAQVGDWIIECATAADHPGPVRSAAWPTPACSAHGRVAPRPARARRRRDRHDRHRRCPVLRPPCRAGRGVARRVGHAEVRHAPRGRRAGRSGVRTRAGAPAARRELPPPRPARHRRSPAALWRALSEPTARRGGKPKSPVQPVSVRRPWHSSALATPAAGRGRDRKRRPDAGRPCGTIRAA